MERTFVLELVLTYSSCYGTCYSWRKQDGHQNLLPRCRKSVPRHQSTLGARAASSSQH